MRKIIEPDERCYAKAVSLPEWLWEKIDLLASANEQNRSRVIFLILKTEIQKLENEKTEKMK